jgi:hypothetical protein
MSLGHVAPHCPRRLLLALLVAVGPAASAAVPTPIVTGPITSPGSAFVASTNFDLAPLRYVEEEFFLSGTATAFTSAEPLGSDGVWSATPADTAAYTTRIVVRRPASRRRFNGTVFVEWLNVSGGLDAAPDWMFTHSFLMREGYAWVGVSAQFVGVAGTGGPLGLNLSLKSVNPARYAPLVHPGDSFSYDMYSQVAQALRGSSGVRPLGGLRPRRLIAIGESQSAFRLTTYVNAIHPLAHVYDGFLIHSRGGGAPQLSQPPQENVPGPTPAFIREDVGVPVLTFETETDLIALGFFAARQPDSKWVRLWEVAGTAHGDVYQLVVGPDDAGRVAADVTHYPPTSSVAGGVITCGSPVNAGQQQYVLSAALARLDRWVRTGRAPRRSAPRLEITGTSPTIERDALGNARGGIRTPVVDAPIAALSGLGQTGASFCGLFGTTVPFDAATLAALYPTHGAYVSAVAKASRAAVKARYLLRPAARAIREAAAASNVGN